jgi:5-oxopent-3-ene-1,2,5-tricarboxylate decarboxylase/2-hydroxyhepta-2,4-diene-1,7-dioate isomerase
MARFQTDREVVTHGMTSPLAGLKTSRIVTSLQQLGYLGQFMTGVRPLTPANSFVGTARTLRLLPTRPDMVKAMNADRSKNPNRVAVDQTQPGDVLVIDARGVTNHAVGGDPFAARVKGAGGVAFITDGAVRNLPGLLALDFPIYAQGVHSSSLNNAHVGVAVNEPIACGGVLVLPGDIIVGDAEGVVVVPAELEAQVAEMSKASEAVDAYSLELLLQGLPMDEAYPLNAAHKAELEARQAKN